MGATELVYLLASLALVAACGVFVAAEFSFVTVDRAAVDREAEGGDPGAVGLSRALRALSTQLSGAQVGITVTNLAIGYLAEPAIADLVAPPLEGLGLPEATVRPVAITTGLVLATVLTMLFGELVPKNVAIARPMATAKATQRLMRGFTTSVRWPIRLLNGSANVVVRRLGIEPQEELRSARNNNELASMVRRSASEGTLDAGTAQLVERSAVFGERTAGEIMTARVRMDRVGVEDSLADVVERARTTGHSRFPVVRAGGDDVAGAIHVKHAVAVPVEQRASTSVRSAMVEATIVPESVRLDPLLGLLRSEGLAMAVVMDEYGGTAGVVTLEDVVEEIVGEIADEHDPERIAADDRGDGSSVVSGLLRPDEVSAETGVALPEHEDYDTVGGLVMQRLGRMPRVGDEVVVALPVRVDAAGDPLPVEEAVLSVEGLEGLRVDRVGVQARERDLAHAEGDRDPSATEDGSRR